MVLEETPLWIVPQRYPQPCLPEPAAEWGWHFKAVCGRGLGGQTRGQWERGFSALVGAAIQRVLQHSELQTAKQGGRPALSSATTGAFSCLGGFRPLLYFLMLQVLLLNLSPPPCPI